MTTEKKARVFTAVDLNYDGWSISYKDENGVAQWPRDKVFEFVELCDYENLAAENEKLKATIIVSESATGLMHQATRIKGLESELTALREQNNEMMKAHVEREKHWQSIVTALKAKVEELQERHAQTIDNNQFAFGCLNYLEEKHPEVEQWIRDYELSLAEEAK